MGRPTMPGCYRDKDDRWCVDKWVEGVRLRRRFEEDFAEAEGWLIAEVNRLKQAKEADRPRYIFNQAAVHYVTLYERKPSLDLEIYLLKTLIPFIGDLFLDQIYDAKLKPYVDARRAKGCKSKTINLAIGVVRRILNLAARSWRDEKGRTWLATAPLLTLEDGLDAREPMPLTWTGQRELLPRLPDHLASMALFDLNCGARDAVVCGLRWQWEVRIPDHGFSAFVVPRPSVKGKKRSRVLVCNSVAQSIIESVRGMHPEFVFVYSQIRKEGKKPKYRPIETMNNTAWQLARKAVNLTTRVHDLRHAVGMRLREAGVAENTISDILWHARKGMTAHYSVAQVLEIRNALELITDERHANNKSLASIVMEADENRKAVNV